MVYGKHQGIVYRVLPAFVTNQNQKMAERFNASVLKTDVAVRLPRVRLPLFPIIRLDVNRML